MAIPIAIPRLGWNMEEGVFGGWLKRDGQEIRAGETVFTLETDKSTEEIESLDGGILNIAATGPKAGDTVAVGVVIGYLLQPGEKAPTREAVGEPSGVSRRVIEKDSEGITRRLTPLGSPETAPTLAAISPRARLAAKELGVDCTTLAGSGRTGRIRERDVRAAVQTPSRSAGSTLRSIIAQRMSASHLTTAPVTLIATVDATALVALRKGFRQAGDTLPSYTDIIIKLSAEALQHHPALNAHWEEDSPSIAHRADIDPTIPARSASEGRVVFQRGIHVGIAVDTPAGLLVPVVRDVPAQSIAEIASRTRALIERARQRKLSADEMNGGTFTVSNLGSFGVDAFTPIINHPECAVLGIGRIQKQPVVIGDRIAIREQMTLSLTFDHRIVDGAPAARFLQTLRELIETKQ